MSDPLYVQRKHTVHDNDAYYEATFADGMTSNSILCPEWWQPFVIIGEPLRTIKTKMIDDQWREVPVVLVQFHDGRSLELFDQ